MPASAADSLRRTPETAAMVAVDGLVFGCGCTYVKQRVCEWATQEKNSSTLLFDLYFRLSVATVKLEKN